MDKLTVFLAVGTVGLGSLSVHLLTELKEARKEAETLQAQMSELEHSSHAAPAREPRGVLSAPDMSGPAAGPPPPPRAARANVALPSASAPVAPSADGAAAMNRAFMDRSKLMEDPEYRAALTMQQKVMLAQQYSDLAAAMNLPPDQVDQLLGLLAEQQMRNMQERPPFRGNTPPDPNEIREWQQRSQERQRQNQEEIRQLLGDSGVEQWKDYQQSMPARSTVKQLRAVLDTAGIPLRQDQVEPLVNAIAAEQRANSQAQAQAAQGQVQAMIAGGAAMPAMTVGRGPNMSAEDRVAMTERSLERLEQYNQRLRSAASAHLTSEQLRRYDQLLQQQADMQRASLRMMRAQAEAEARGEIQPAAYPNTFVVPAGAAAAGEFRPAPGR